MLKMRWLSHKFIFKKYLLINNYTAAYGKYAVKLSVIRYNFIFIAKLTSSGKILKFSKLIENTEKNRGKKSKKKITLGP